MAAGDAEGLAAYHFMMVCWPKNKMLNVLLVVIYRVFVCFHMPWVIELVTPLYRIEK